MAAAEPGAQGAALLFFARLNLLFLVKIGLYILNGNTLFYIHCTVLHLNCTRMQFLEQYSFHFTARSPATRLTICIALINNEQKCGLLHEKKNWPLFKLENLAKEESARLHSVDWDSIWLPETP